MPIGSAARGCELASRRTLFSDRTLVGDPETIAGRLRGYADIGIDTVISSGYPHLEEAYRVAELLFPKLNLVHRPSRLPAGFAPAGRGA